jgi:hypothetical protein
MVQPPEPALAAPGELSPSSAKGSLEASVPSVESLIPWSPFVPGQAFTVVPSEGDPASALGAGASVEASDDASLALAFASAKRSLGMHQTSDHTDAPCDLHLRQAPSAA